MANSLRIFEFKPSEATTRSCVLAKSAALTISVPKSQIDAQRKRALLEQIEQLLAADAAEAVASRDDAIAAIVHRYVVPIGEMLADGFCAQRIVAGEIIERLIGQHHAPAEGVVGTVTLDHGNVMCGIAQLHADREIKACRPTAEARNLHAVPSFSP